MSFKRGNQGESGLENLSEIKKGIFSRYCTIRGLHSSKLDSRWDFNDYQKYEKRELEKVGKSLVGKLVIEIKYFLQEKVKK